MTVTATIDFDDKEVTKIKELMEYSSPFHIVRELNNSESNWLVRKLVEKCVEKVFMEVKKNDNCS